MCYIRVANLSPPYFCANMHLLIFCFPYERDYIKIIKIFDKMKLFLMVFVVVLSSLYLADRLFNIVKCFMKGVKFEQNIYQRLLSFFALASLITFLIV